MGGRSGGSRDAIMRNLLAENLEKASSKRIAAEITERNSTDAYTGVAETEAAIQPAQTNQPQATSASRGTIPATTAALAQQRSEIKSDARLEAKPESRSEAKTEPAPLTSGVIQTQAIAAIPGSSEPMKPVKVKTVQIKAGAKLASVGAAQPTAAITSAMPARTEVAETSKAIVAKAETGKSETGKVEAGKAEARPETGNVEAARPEWPPQPANHGTGNGILGVLPASSLPSTAQALAYADPAPRPQPQASAQTAASKPEATHTGWIIQVGALETESEARQRLEAARNQAHGLLNKADSFTEPVLAKGDKKLFRARFAGLDRDQAEAVCRMLKRSDISCITVRN
jgi:D-alanyl-D-alanine carboxypeptidase